MGLELRSILFLFEVFFGTNFDLVTMDDFRWWAHEQALRLLHVLLSFFSFGEWILQELIVKHIYILETWIKRILLVE